MVHTFDVENLRSLQVDKKITDILYDAISRAMDVIQEQYSPIDGQIVYDDRVANAIDRLIDITNYVEEKYRHPQGVILNGVCVHE